MTDWGPMPVPLSLDALRRARLPARAAWLCPSFPEIPLEPGHAARPGTFGGVLAVGRAALAHEGVAGAGVGVELVILAEAGQLQVELLHVRGAGVGILGTEQTEHRRKDAQGEVE